MSLVTASELSNYMSGFRMNDAQAQTAQVILDGVQANLESYLNRPLERMRSREMVRVDRSGYLNVRHTPIEAVLRIQNYGDTLPAPIKDRVPNYTVEKSDTLPIHDYVPENNGADMIVPGGVKYGAPGSYVLIEYLSGGSRFIQDRIPQIKLAIMRVAAREMTAMNDDTMSLRGDSAQAARPANNLPPEWTQDELAQFDRLRRRVMA